MAGSDLDLLDPEDFYAEFDRRARARRERKRPQGRRVPRLRLGRRPPRRDDSHDQRSDDPSLLGSGGGRALVGIVAAIAVFTVVGLIALWPHGSGEQVTTPGFGPSVAAKTLSVRTVACPDTPGVRCQELIVSVRGHDETVALGAVNAAPAVSPGTPIRVAPVSVPATPGTAASVSWQFVDIDRHVSLLWLAAVVLLAAVAVIRWRGLLAAIGVGLSLLLVSTFLVPAILDGHSALLVSLVCALAVMFATLVLTSGFGAQTLAAALGIGSTLILSCGLALIAIHYVHLDGRTDELSAYLGTVSPGLSLQGIVLAGMIIGSLGVLADTAVTQASAVMVLRRTDPTLGSRALYRAAFHVGRDHLSATIHTLVLAYVGASLPLLLITRATHVGFLDAVNTQDIAQPIAATLVGCLGLVCAVPLTTGLAATLVARVPSEALRSVHAHQH